MGGDKIDVDVDEFEDMEDELFGRCALLRGIKIWLNSSALIESRLSTASPEFHLGRG